jgi:radical SAM superfamily enzyme YgiQ (UPF0313 family)
MKRLTAHEGKFIIIVDDCFLTDTKRAEAIFRKIKDSDLRQHYFIQSRADLIVKNPKLIENWKSIGLEAVFMGFEDFCQERLAEYGCEKSLTNNIKALELLNSIGVYSFGSFIIDPHFSLEDFRQYQDYLSSFPASQVLLNVLTPYPGTEIYEDSAEILDAGYELFDGFHAVTSTALPQNEFYRNYLSLYLSFFKSKLNKTFEYPPKYPKMSLKPFLTLARDFKKLTKPE